MKKASINKPNKEQWKRLYDTAIKIGQMKPWEKLYDTDLITIMLPGQEEPVYCSVMGKAGECYGIGVYPGYESINKFMQMLDLDPDEPEGVTSLSTMLSQDCINCYFGNREEITTVDRESIKMLELKFRGRNNWIYFRSMKPGLLPWYINGEQAEFLAETLENLYAACEDYMEGRLEVDFENEETLLRQYSPKEKAWSNINASLEIPVLSKELIISDQILTARLKKQKKTPAALELDMMYMPSPIQEEDDPIPWMPRIILIADRQSGLLLNQYMPGKDEPAEDTIIGLLDEYIMKHGRPSAIYVRDDNTGCYLNDFCEKVKVNLIISDGSLALDSFLESLMNYIQ